MTFIVLLPFSFSCIVFILLAYVIRLIGFEQNHYIKKTLEYVFAAVGSSDSAF